MIEIGECMYETNGTPYSVKPGDTFPGRLDPKTHLVEYNIPEPPDQADNPIVIDQTNGLIHPVETEVEAAEKSNAKVPKVAHLVTELYRDKRYRPLQPENLERAATEDAHFRALIDPNTPVELPLNQLHRIATEPGRRVTNEERPTVAMLIAAASARQHEAVDGSKQLWRLLGHDKIREAGYEYLIRNLIWFRARSIVDLDDRTLTGFGLSHEKLAKLPQSDQGQTQLDEVPLFFAQLATDVANHNSHSVLPHGTLARLSGRQKVYHQKEVAADVTKQLQSYLVDGYKLYNPKGKDLAALAECYLALRQGFTAEAHPLLQLRTAQRTEEIFKRTSAVELPLTAQAVVARCREITDSAS